MVPRGAPYETSHRVYPRVQPGDLLWGREAFWEGGRRALDVYGEEIEFVGSKEVVGYCATDKYPNTDCIKRSPIYMPRWASRLRLAVTRVWIERLHDLTPEGAFAEGVRCDCMNPEACRGSRDLIPRYGVLWDRINGPRGYPWESNPLVIVYEFYRKENIQ